MGLLGASVTLSVKRELPWIKVVGYSHREQTRQVARNMSVANDIADTLEECVADADIVILASPIKTFQEYFRQMAPFLKAGCIVTDVGSTKKLVYEWAKKNLPDTVCFVGSHPIAGSEKRGVEFARDDLLAGSKCILTQTPETSKAAMETLEQLWSKLGCKVRVMTPTQHDRVFGMVSHLPHMAAACLVNANSDEDIKFAGKGFIDTSRIASGPANVWSDILLTNRQTSIKCIDKLIRELQKIQMAIKENDEKKVEKLLNKARTKRQALIDYKIEQGELF